MDFTINCKVGVILPAGGVGERLGVFPPKQFILIDGKPLLCYAIEAFEKISWIGKIVVVIAAKYEDEMKSLMEKYNYCKVQIAHGKSTRHRSIAAGIKFLENDAPDIVIIHDVVRPLVPTEILENVTLAAKEHKAAGPICPLTSTILRRDQDHFLSYSLDRQQYFASEMPQAFEFRVIQDAYKKCEDFDLDHGTECLHLVDKYCNVKAKLVDGTADLWKVTYPKDMYAAEMILTKKTNNALVSMGKLQADVAIKIINKLKANISVTIMKDQTLDEDFRDKNLVIFHSGCQLKDISTCCSNFASSKLLPRILIHVIHEQNSQIEFTDIFRMMTKFSNTINNFCLAYAIWKMKEEWSEENITQMTDIISELLSKKSTNFAGQVFTIC